MNATQSGFSWFLSFWAVDVGVAAAANNLREKHFAYTHTHTHTLSHTHAVGVEQSNMRWICSKHRCFLTRPPLPQPQQAPLPPLPSQSQPPPIFSNAHAGERFTLVPLASQIRQWIFQCVFGFRKFASHFPDVSYQLCCFVVCANIFVRYVYVSNFFFCVWWLGNLAHGAVCWLYQLTAIKPSKWCEKCRRWRCQRRFAVPTSPCSHFPALGPRLGVPVCVCVNVYVLFIFIIQRNLRRASCFVVWNSRVVAFVISPLLLSHFSYFHLVSFCCCCCCCCWICEKCVRQLSLPRYQLVSASWAESKTKLFLFVSFLLSFEFEYRINKYIAI